MKGSFLKTMLISLTVILAITTIGLIVLLNTQNDSAEGKEATIDDIVKYSYETSEMTTDLEDGSFVRIQFQIVTDGKKAREELEKREFQVKNILIKNLASMDEDDFKAGLGELEDTIQSKLNDVMTKGKITDVYTVNKILQ